MKRIAIIDGNSLINRAYYAMKNPMITREGIYTHGIFGFLNMLEKLRRDYEPEYLAVAFDLKGPTFRHEEYEEYKAGRRKMPPELAMQIPILKDILDAMGLARIEVGGFEADDIIGTVARQAEEEGLEPVIFTGDKDQLQLATDVTRVVFTKRGVSDFDIYDREAFQEAYGFTPLQFIDYKGLAGDTSDNIPGIPGVGAKTATKLIRQYGSVEEIIAHKDEIKPDGLRKKVEENETLALMSKRLATIDTHAPVKESLEDLRIGEGDMDELIALYRKLEFNRFLKKLNVSADQPAASGAPAAQEIDLEKIEKTTIEEAGELNKLKVAGEAVLRIFGDNSHVTDPVVEGASLLTDDCFYYITGEALKAFPAWICGQDLKVYGHGIKKDLYMLLCKGAGDMEVSFDTQIAQYVLDPGKNEYSLTVLSTEYLRETVPEEKDFLASVGQMDMFSNSQAQYMDYGLRWCAAVKMIRPVQEGLLAEAGMETVFRDVELPLVSVLAAMEKDGFTTNRQFLREFGETMSEEIDKLTASIHEMAGEDFNINSPAQLGDILFEKLQLPHGKKTKRGYSTSADILEKILDDHPIVSAVLEYRSLTKLKSTYVDGLIPLINDRDGKIHAHFMQTVAATGRISCTEPNLQNIPIRQELGRRLRQAFVPDEGHILVGADYSQIELRVLAHMSGDDALIRAFEQGEDIHRATAANVLGIPEEEITPEERSRAKAVNFGVIYGMSAFGLSSNLNITRKEAEEYIDAYFAKHEKVKQFMDDQVAFARENGYVETMLGRKRYIKEIRASQFPVRQLGERLAMNSPIQGSAADIIKIAMIKVYKALAEQNLKSRLILQIHDELIIHTLKEEKEIVEKLLVENMEDAIEMKVPLKAELGEGENWYALK